VADTREYANQVFDLFQRTCKAQFPKAVECLVKNREVLLAFYAFPVEHWIHLRTTNLFESTFATDLLQTQRTKEHGSRIAGLTMVYRLRQSALEKKWRLLNGTQVIVEVLRGTISIDGIFVPQVAA
jgi:putative transposase